MTAEEIIHHWRCQYQYEHKRKAYDSHYCCEDLPYGNFFCASPYCGKHCYRWEGKHYKKMTEATDMQIYRLILPIGDTVPPPLLSSIWHNFARRLRRLYPSCEWYWVLEYQNDNLHLHVLIKSTDPISYHEVDDKWRKTLAKQGLRIGVGTVRVKDVDDVQDLASYNTKSRRAKPWEYRPPTGLYRNLAFASRGWHETESEAVNVEAAVDASESPYGSQWDKDGTEEPTGYYTQSEKI